MRQKRGLVHLNRVVAIAAAVRSNAVEEERGPVRIHPRGQQPLLALVFEHAAPRPGLNFAPHLPDKIGEERGPTRRRHREQWR